MNAILVSQRGAAVFAGRSRKCAGAWIAPLANDRRRGDLAARLLPARATMDKSFDALAINKN